MKTPLIILVLLLCTIYSQNSIAKTISSGKNDLTKKEVINIYPNPIKQKGTIEIKIESSSKTKIEFYDLSGKKVKELKEIELDEGTNKVQFHADDFNEGYYFCKVTTDQWVKTKRILVRR